MRKSKIKKLKNIRIIDRKSTYIDKLVKMGEGVVIYPNNTIYGSSVIEDGVVLMPNNVIINSHVGKESKIVCSYIENSQIGQKCEIGPYARLRPNSKIGDFCKIGNFVEVKNAVLGENTKAGHLAYIGDVDIEENCNVGCGVIFANYDGKKKHRSSVGKNCFIGSNSNIIAPVNIAKNTYICAGTTITENTKEEDFIIGRVKAQTKPKRAGNYLKEIQ